MAVAETAKSSGKASGGNRARRKARSALCSGGMWLQANQGEGYGLPCLQRQFKSGSAQSIEDWVNDQVKKIEGSK